MHLFIMYTSSNFFRHRYKEVIEGAKDTDGHVPVWYLNRDTPLSTVKLLDFPVKKFDEVRVTLIIIIHQVVYC